jgi:ATP-dependent Clp protease ATP-binding subunit ClpA
MNTVLQPRMGFQAAGLRREMTSGEVDAETSSKMSNSAIDAARRKFTPEFINRLDKIVVFQPLGNSELRRIVEIELDAVRDRIAKQAPDRSFEFTVTDAAKDYLLAEGTDIRYGARHLKRAIDRLLVQPLASLIASDQVRGGDLLSIDHPQPVPGMAFARVGERLIYGAEAA